MSQSVFQYRGYKIALIEHFGGHLYEVIGGVKYYKNLEDAKKAIDDNIEAEEDVNESLQVQLDALLSAFDRGDGANAEQ